jgi:Lipase (class 3)
VRFFVATAAATDYSGVGCRCERWYGWATRRSTPAATYFARQLTVAEVGDNRTVSAIPCPQAARSPGTKVLPPSPVVNIVTDEPVIPLQNLVADALPAALVDQSITWPYHLPSFNGVDCLWWSMLVRSMYAADDSWLRRVASWAGPVARLSFVGRANPASQGYGLVELTDSVLIVIPGTSSEAEALTYFLTHSLRLLYTAAEGWQINATWAGRGSQVLLGYTAWATGRPFKPVIIVGHSSGAAYGAYCAYALFSDAQHPFTLVTFGAPIWGTESLKSQYVLNGELPKTVDFINPNDLVPTIPPPWAAVDLLFPLLYAFVNRPSYKRINTPLQLGSTSGPVQVQQPLTLDAIVNAIRTLVTGGGIDVQHATATYTAAADTWAGNDPSIAANQLTPAYNSLKTILADMNAAGLY